MSGSITFNGTNAYLQLAATAQLAIPASTAFTVECWVYPTVSSGTIFSESATSGTNSVALMLGFCDGTNPDSAGSYLVLAARNGSTWVAGAISTVQVAANVWTHVAGVFTGSTTRIFINGTDVTKLTSPTPATAWPVLSSSGDAWYLGRRWDTSIRVWYSGYISNFRIIIGTAVYTANFTVPTDDLPLLANTKLLLANTAKNTLDSSSNRLATVANGTIQAAQFNPFRLGWLGDGIVAQENFDLIDQVNDNRQRWQNQRIGFDYK